MRYVNSLKVLIGVVCLAALSSATLAQDNSTSQAQGSSAATISCSQSQTVLLAANGNRLSWWLKNTSGGSTVGVYFTSQVTTSAANRQVAFTNAVLVLLPGATLTPATAGFSLKPALYNGAVYGITSLLDSTNSVRAQSLDRP